MSHKSERDSSPESEKKRASPRGSESSKKDVRSTEDESRTNDEELESTDTTEDSSDRQTMSHEESQILEDLYALEMVLEELISRRTGASESPSPSSRSSSATSDTKIRAGERESLSGESQSIVGERQVPAIERLSLADETRSIESEEERVQEDVNRLDRFLGEMDDKRAHGRKTPPVDPKAKSTAAAEKVTTGVIKYEHKKDSRLSHILAIDDEITEEIKKVDAELRKESTKGIPKTGSVEPRQSGRSSVPTSPNVATRSTSKTREVTKDSQYGENVESETLEASWSNFEGFNLPSETSSVQTLPPSNTDIVVQYNPDFLTSSPSVSMSDTFIRRTLKRILDLKTEYPDQKLYLISSSSPQVAELPQLSSLFKVAASPQSNSQVPEEPSASSFSSGSTPSVSISSPGGNTTSSVEMESLSGEDIPTQLVNLIGQAFLDYFGGSRPKASPTTDAVKPSESPIEFRDKENTVSDDNIVEPDGRVQRARTVSLPAKSNGAPRDSARQARQTSPAVPLSAVSSAEAAKHVEDHEPGVKTTATSKQLEASDASLKSSLRSASVTQSPMKQKPAAASASAVPSSETVEPASLVTVTSSFIKKKVSFADMNSTMYIMVNPSSDGLESARSSRESVEYGMDNGGATPDTAHHEDDNGAQNRNSSSSSTSDCIHPHLITSTPICPIRSDALPCCSKKTRRTSTETLADLTPSSHAITSSITHVMCRARSPEEQGHQICGSKERWVTRVNSRSLSFTSDDAVCASCGSESFHSNISDCISLRGVSPSPSDCSCSAGRRSQSSCSNCTTNKNCSCCQKKHGEESDSQALVKERTSAASFPPDAAGSISSLGHCNIAADESQNSDVSSTVCVVFNKRDRKRTKNKFSEK